MNAILGSARLALSTRLNDRQQKLVAAIRTAADSLLALLNNILDLSKIEAGQLQLEQVAFRPDELLESVRITMDPLARQKGIELLVKADFSALPEYVRGDETRLCQVLFNLVNNAIKFTDRGSVTIMATATMVDSVASDRPVLFSVIDTGVGIPAEKRTMIFENFTQADASTARKYGGSGLGLTISRQLIELMGGRIWLSSTPGHGTTFHFTVTLTPGPRPAATSQPAGLAPDGQSLRILLVEDNEFNQFITRELLEQRQHHVDVAGNGLEGLEAIAGRDYDLVLMDVQMPVMDGITACGIIRSAEYEERPATGLPGDLPDRLISRLHRRHLPVTALTANAMTDDREACRNAGMDGYLTKPFTPEQLFEAVSTAVQARNPSTEQPHGKAGP
jgi:CheY-like chemotaxis protein